jgi:hypothetical protein
MIQKPNTPVNPTNAVEEGTQPTGKLSFRDYINVGTSLKAIVDGVYDAVIINTKFVPNEKDPDKDYLRLEIQLPDRVTVENRFVSGYFIFEREIKTQLGISDQSIPVPALLNAIIGQPIKVWYKTIVSPKDNRKYQNMSFSEPLPDPVAATDAVPKF